MHFGPWELLAFGALWIGGFMLAADVGLRMSPNIRAKLPRLERFQDTGWWGFTPFILLTVAGTIFLLNALGWLPGETFHEITPRTWQFIGPLVLLGFVVVIWTMRRSNKSGKVAALTNKQEELKNVRDPQTERGLLILLDYAVYQSALLMLEDILRAAPNDIVEGPLQMDKIASERADTREFIEVVRRKLDPGSWRRSIFEGVMQQAEQSAEHQLEQTPIEVRPSNLDPLALRKCAISYAQCAEAIRFLRQEKTDVMEKLINQRSTLLEQYRLRNPS